MARWPRGSHGGTYGGNPIGRAAALATIDVLTAPGFLDNVNARGAQLLDGLRSVQADDAGLRQVRGVGLVVGDGVRSTPAGRRHRAALSPRGPARS